MRRRLFGAILALIALRLALTPLYPLLDTSEGRYGLIPLVMLQTGDWVTPSIAPDLPYLAKPPLSFWLTAISYVAFGVSEWAARLPALLSIVGCGALVWRLACERGREFAALAALAYATSAYVFFVAGAVMPDASFGLAVTLALAGFRLATTGQGRVWGYAFFVGLAASLMIKGPVGPALVGLPIAVFVLWRREWAGLARLPWLSGSALVVALVAPWYVVAERHSPGFLSYFIVGEHIQRYLDPHWPDRYGHGKIWPMGTIWLFALAGSAPWSLVALWRAARGRASGLFARLRAEPFAAFLVAWVGAQLLFFTFPRIPLISYTTPTLPAIALLSAYVVCETGGLRAAPARRAMAGLALLAPLGVAVFALLAHARPDSRWLSTQRDVVAAQEQAERTHALLYLKEIPFSARFYGEGHVALAQDWAEIGRRLRSEQVWLAVRADRLAQAPADLRARLHQAFTSNGYVVLKSDAPHG